MTSVIQRRRNDVLPPLDVVIQALRLAKDGCGLLPAQLILGCAISLLDMIRVGFTKFYNYELLTQVYLGLHGQQTRFPRTRKILREYISNPQPGIE